MTGMRTKDFYFDLPPELVAQRPSDVRGDDRLMVLDRATGAVRHCVMQNLPDLVEPGTLMVFNNSRVRRSRCYGVREDTGRGQEFLFLARKPLQKGAAGECWQTMVRGAKKVRVGHRYRFADGSVGVVESDEAENGTEFRTVCFDCALDEDWFERNGHIPLPPYIRRADDGTDSERYQTVFATETGSSACPTAGLHFTEAMLERLRTRGIDTAFVTLHVGLGTFLPVRAERVEEHRMHEEVYSVPPETAAKIEDAKRAGRAVLAVGTTSVRTLESAAVPDERVPGSWRVRAGVGATSIFMYPGYQFKIVEQLFTNFHTPESTLLMLVSAFAGREHILAAYRAAVEQRYHFFSYGDAMLIR